MAARMAFSRSALHRAAPFVLPLAPALGLGGCISLGSGKVPDTLVTLTPAVMAPAGAGSSGQSNAALVVLDPETDRRLNVQRIAVQVDATSVAYLKQALWVERPARLFRSLLAETIRARGARLVFEDADAAASGRTRLAGRLIDMGYDAGSRAVIVRYDAIVETAGDAVSTRRFEARVDNVEPNARAIAPALNKAANDVARQVADWMG